ncbi:putative pentatricopeptide repeat-containing protein At5g52630 [Lycium barbarum]|uniref:putative pentatricopeptide repeat-containing protein At5g52630 n=1 Tax=Lycium barbarum TaxID=112863 RepID=UPI00293E044C|nr:putative pentatricopeptide repeat-containing protein At5g52630 [Lycium barbarum]XP_060205708.1 putative pentatricopeptide repeat-containing protein At5g52630 [Lycium barbarum]XP_060205709.1 putative pentatricopeptide repeat-containing protein At5g52630 [Lycium barbarum]XP_060205710.1 putative pentatricopeptide repeat-containing protein At5g52630 [Lycium barbarum]XP_060205711.1 putative pentatricopeptide repeat-containing protein At5g52630 [Lycium barbarum]XP_060205712.1 putative pentatricop
MDSIDPRCIHAQAITTGAAKSNRAVLNNLITLYSKSNLPSQAARVFQSIPSPNVVSWTALTSAFSNSPLSFHHFIAMLRHPSRILPNSHTLTSLLKTCASLTALTFGLQLHSVAVKLGFSSELFTASSLVSLYFKTGLSSNAKKVFDEMSVRDAVSFSSVIVGFAQNSKPIDALSCFVEMRRSGMASTMVSVSGALRAASDMAMLEQCRIIHGHAMITGLNLNAIVGSALIDGYGKCGLIGDARGVFDEIEMELNIVGWNAMMAAHAQQGEHDNVIKLFTLMEERGMVPDEYSFLAILTAFYNAGLVEETEIWFRRMTEEYSLEPCIEHYTCLVGALGKAGRLEEAERIALTMPFKPDAALWRVLLSKCVHHVNMDIAWRMSDRLLEINQMDDSAYVILANAYASAGRWDEVREVWKRMKDKKVRKEGGKSWIEALGEVHVFLAGDRRHERTDEIYAKLAELMEEIEKLGYVPVWTEMLHEVEEKEKKKALWYHSEKLALAFGLLNGTAPPGKALRIVKNLRICRDCHEAFKYISRLVEREIIVRDVNRYHRFLNGSCNCGDQW